MYKPWNLIVLASVVIKNSSQLCQNPVTRKEFRDLTTEEANRFLNAVQKLHNTPHKGTELSRYDYFTKVHMENRKIAHNRPSFMPWHRQFIRNMEKELQNIDSSVVLPYWDWTLDSQEPHKSPIFNSSAFGGNGQGSEKCVKDGKFANWTVSYPNKHCLKRDFNQGETLSTYSLPEEVILDLNEPRFSDFSQQLEFKHAHPHISIGGKHGDLLTMYSPNDPIFYMHHAFVDKLWAEWQIRHPNSPYDGSRYKLNSAATTDKLSPFDITVEDTLNTLSDDYCYIYEAYPHVYKVTPPTESSDLPALNNENGIKPTYSKIQQLQKWTYKSNPFIRGRYSKLTLSQFLKTKLFQFLSIPSPFSIFYKKLQSTPQITPEFIEMNEWDPYEAQESTKRASQFVRLLNNKRFISLSRITELYRTLKS